MVFSIFKNGKDFVTKKQETILSAAVIMMVATIATKLLGLFKIVLLANIYGTSRQLDIFYAANTIPEIIFNILVLGSLNTALIPVLSEVLMKKGNDEMSKIFSTFLSCAAVVLGIVGLLGIIFAPQVTYLLVHLNVTTPNPPFTPLELSNMTFMIRVLFISPVILGISFLVSGILIVHKRFVITQLASVLYTLGFIISIFIFVPFMGIIGLCWGVVLGSVLHLVVQLPVLKFLDIHLKPSFNFKDQFVKRIGVLMLPRIIGLAGDQLGAFVDTVLALGLLSGSLTAFKYAYTYYIFPVSLIGWSFAQAAFPTLTDEYANGKMDSFKENFMRSLQQTLYLILPLTVIFITLRLPLVRLLGIGQNTQFGWDGTIVTAWVLFFFGLDIIFQSVLSILIRGYYAMQDTRTPVKASLFALVINVVLSIYLVHVFGRFNVNEGVMQNLLHFQYYFSGKGGDWMAVGGLAAAGTISSAIETAIVFVIFLKKVNGFHFDQLFVPLYKKLASTLIMAIVMYACYRTLDTLMNTSRTLELVFLILISCYVGITVYILSSYLFQDEDIDLVFRVINKLKNFLYAKKDISSQDTVVSIEETN
jgi:putative peptidoglycan lipid II flippase